MSKINIENWSEIEEKNSCDMTDCWEIEKVSSWHDITYLIKKIGEKSVLDKMYLIQKISEKLKESVLDRI